MDLDTTKLPFGPTLLHHVLINANRKLVDH
jgi:hypothetical protein